MSSLLPSPPPHPLSHSGEKNLSGSFRLFALLSVTKDGNLISEGREGTEVPISVSFELLCCVGMRRLPYLKSLRLLYVPSVFDMLHLLCFSKQ